MAMRRAFQNGAYTAFFSISVSCSVCIAGYLRTKVSRSCAELAPSHLLLLHHALAHRWTRVVDSLRIGSPIIPELIIQGGCWRVDVRIPTVPFRAARIPRLRSIGHRRIDSGDAAAFAEDDAEPGLGACTRGNGRDAAIRCNSVRLIEPKTAIPPSSRMASGRTVPYLAWFCPILVERSNSSVRSLG